MIYRLRLSAPCRKRKQILALDCQILSKWQSSANQRPTPTATQPSYYPQIPWTAHGITLWITRTATGRTRVSLTFPALFSPNPQRLRQPGPAAKNPPGVSQAPQPARRPRHRTGKPLFLRPAVSETHDNREQTGNSKQINQHIKHTGQPSEPVLLPRYTTLSVLRLLRNVQICPDPAFRHFRAAPQPHRPRRTTGKPRTASRKTPLRKPRSSSRSCKPPQQRSHPKTPSSAPRATPPSGTPPASRHNCPAHRQQ